MTKFEELCNLYSKSRTEYFQYQDESHQFASSLIQEFIKYFEIPIEQISYFPTDKDLENGKRYTMFGAMHLDNDTFWHLGIIITLYQKDNQLHQQPVSMVIKFKKEKNDFIVTIKGIKETFSLNPKEIETFHPFFDIIFQEIAKMFEGELQRFLENSPIPKNIGF